LENIYVFMLERNFGRTFLKVPPGEVVGDRYAKDSISEFPLGEV
jgi:hypothetical protein